LLEHPELTIRRALFKFSTHLIDECCNEFSLRCLKACLKVPLTYIDNRFSDIFLQNSQSNVELSNEVCLFLNSFHEKMTNRFADHGSVIDLTNRLHEELFEHIKRLPFLMRNMQPQKDKPEMVILTKDDLACSLRTLIGFYQLLNREGLYDFLKLDQH